VEQDDSRRLVIAGLEQVHVELVNAGDDMGIDSGGESHGQSSVLGFLPLNEEASPVNNKSGACSEHRMNM